jgi:hypothetical protein
MSFFLFRYGFGGQGDLFQSFLHPRNAQGVLHPPCIVPRSCISIKAPGVVCKLDGHSCTNVQGSPEILPNCREKKSTPPPFAACGQHSALVALAPRGHTLANSALVALAPPGRMLPPRLLASRGACCPLGSGACCPLGALAPPGRMLVHSALAALAPRGHTLLHRALAALAPRGHTLIHRALAALAPLAHRATPAARAALAPLAQLLRLGWI